MAPYHHRVNTHHKSKRARKIRKLSVIAVLLLFLGVGVVAVDWLIGNLKSEETVVSIGSSATVQSARINIFQTPYFRFQAGDNWKEVSDELNLKEGDNTLQYLYRKFNKNFIDNELWVTVNLPENYRTLAHNIPTRVLPVRVEADGSLTQLGSVSEHCREVLPEENPFLEPHVVIQDEISYYCHPNEANDYHVAVGIPGGSNRLPMPHGDGKVTITITFRDISTAPSTSELEKILTTFKSL